MLEGGFPAVPAVQMACVDVRDVALAHVRAISRPETNGQRILVGKVPAIWLKDYMKTLGDEFGSQGIDNNSAARAGYCLHTMTVPYALLWIAARFDNLAAQALPIYGYALKLNNSKVAPFFMRRSSSPKLSWAWSTAAQRKRSSRWPTR